MLANPAYSFYQKFWQAVDWIFPPSCAGCGRSGVRWCESCLRHTHLIQEPFCEICGRHTISTPICAECMQNQPVYSAARAWGYFIGPLRKALHRLKYEHDLGLGDTFGKILLELVQKLDWKFDLVVPVPLSKKRLNERGYNQSALLAYPLALGSGVRYAPGALHRIKHSESQVKLGVLERRKNVHGAFEANQDLVEGKRVLLIDDIRTTGATLTACSEALLAKGSISVCCLTLALAVHPDNRNLFLDAAPADDYETNPAIAMAI